MPVLLAIGGLIVLLAFAASAHAGQSGSTLPPAAQNAAIAMNQALAAHGYKRSDMPLYAAFQKLAGLKADGYPGAHTMSALKTALTSLGVAPAPVKVYPWTGNVYDGVHAPPASEWETPVSTGAAPSARDLKVARELVMRAHMGDEWALSAIRRACKVDPNYKKLFRRIAREVRA